MTAVFSHAVPRRALLVTLALATAFLALGAAKTSPAFAQLTIAEFDGGVSNFDSNGDPVVATQAGSHPDQAKTVFSFDTVDGPNFTPLLPPVPYPAEALKDTHVELPPGLVGNPQAMPTCPDRQLTNNQCPVATQIGYVKLDLVQSTVYGTLYNMEQSIPSAPARMGFNVFATGPVYLDASLRTDGDYGIDVDARNASQGGSPISVEVTVWGTPADPINDKDRGTGLVPNTQCYLTDNPACSNSVDLPRIPFLTLPTSCSGPVETRLEVDSWESPGIWDLASFLSHDNAVPTPNPIGNDGCSAVPFEPTLKARPTTNVADSPTGLDFELGVPQNEDPDGISSAHLRDTTVTLPEGLILNPSSANGLDGCTPSQIDLKGAKPAQCPNASKVGTVEVETPLLSHPVPGAVYVAMPYDNPFNSLLAIYIALHDPLTGVVVKVAGKVETDPHTGRLTTTVTDNPQLPFESFKINFFGGAGAPLRTPAVCGAYSTTSSLTPWSAPESGPPATPSDSYAIVHQPGGGECASTHGARQHRPAFEAGTVSPIASAYSPLVINLRREDGSQELSAVTVKPPPGLVGKLAGIPACPDSSLVVAEARSGKEEQASPSCPAASEVGSAVAGAGAGPAPYHAPGKVYLAGPYKGAPLSVAIVTPAVAGPFDLGTVVVRAALHVDPRTAQITAVSDPIPHILKGIVLDVRTITVRMDRPEFVRNPSSCNPMSVGGEIGSILGQVAAVSSRFQVAECGRLGLKPRVNLQLFGGTKRAKYQGVRAVVRPRPGDANIAGAVVRFPTSAFVAQEHLNNICTRVQWAAEACPKGSVYGRAIARSPLLDYPLEGNLHLRSSNNVLPDLVADLRGPAHQPIRIEVAIRNDSVKGALRNTVQSAPDAPVSFFRLQTFGGKKGLIVNSRDICRGRNAATVSVSAHNGRRSVQSVPVRNARCAKQRPQRGKR